MTRQEVLKAIKLDTLKKYVALGLIGRPTVKHEANKTISFYPDDTLEKIGRIKALKDRGCTLEEIKERFDLEKEQPDDPDSDPISLNKLQMQRKMFIRDRQIISTHLDKYIYPLISQIEGELKEEIMGQLASLDIRITKIFSRYKGF